MVIGNFNLHCQASDSSSCFSTGNLVVARINLKPAALKDFVFDWELCLRLLRSLLFSEFGRFGITNQTHPKS